MRNEAQEHVSGETCWMFNLSGRRFAILSWVRLDRKLSEVLTRSAGYERPKTQGSCALEVYKIELFLIDLCFDFFQIRNALEKERESTDRERVRHQAKLEEIRDKYESALKQVREELEAERQGHTHLNASVNKIKKVWKQSLLFCDCLAAMDYFTRKPHENLYHFVLLKSTQFLWCSNKTRLRLITPGILEKKSSNSIHQPLGILEETSKSCCISHSANIPSGSLNFRNSCSLPTVMESTFR